MITTVCSKFHDLWPLRPAGHPRGERMWSRSQLTSHWWLCDDRGQTVRLFSGRGRGSDLISCSGREVLDQISWTWFLKCFLNVAGSFKQEVVPMWRVYMRVGGAYNGCAWFNRFRLFYLKSQFASNRLSYPHLQSSSTQFKFVLNSEIIFFPATLPMMLKT